MKKWILLLLLAFGWNQSWAQKGVSEKDSLKLTALYQTLFKAIAEDDHKTLDAISADRIYCIICLEKPDPEDNYMLSKEDFIKNHLQSIRSLESYQRATKSTKIRLLRFEGFSTSWVVSFETYARGELDPNHEGEVFVLKFDKDDDEFKFTGMEVLP